MVELAIFATLLVIGYTIGSGREKAHFIDIQKREKELLNISVRAEFEAQYENVEVKLIYSSIVIASDYFKAFLVSVRSIIGGQMRSQETLMDRARRECLLRLKKQAADWGADEIIGYRVMMTSLDQVGVELMAYGTAVKRK